MDVTLDRPSILGRHGLHSWAVSFCLHLLAIGFALSFLGHLQLAPMPEPFRWQVTMVERSRPAPAERPVAAESQATRQPERRHSRVEAVAGAAESQPPSAPVQPPAQATQAPVESPRPEAAAPPAVAPVEAPSSGAAGPSLAATGVPDQPASASQEIDPAPLPKPYEAVVEPTLPTSPVGLADRSGPIAEATAQEGQVVPPARARESAEPPKAAGPEQAAAGPHPAPVIEEASSVREPAAESAPAPADFGWLATALWERVSTLRHYPLAARVNRLEGQVVLQVVVLEGGGLKEARVSESSGHAVLDANALDVVRRAFPLQLAQGLGRPEVVVQVPIHYRLRR